MLEYLYVVLLAGVLIHAFTSFIKDRINTIVVFDMAFILYYIVPPLRRLLDSRFVGLYQYRYGLEEQPSYTAFIYIVIFYTIFSFISVLITKRIKKKKFDFVLCHENRTTRSLAIGVLVFSVIAFLLYCSLYGGVIQVFSNISDIRDGLYESTGAKYEFLSKLYNVIIFAPMILVANYKNNRVLCIVCFVVTLAIEISTGSRGALLIFGLIIVIPYINKAKSLSKVITYVTIIGFMAIVFLSLYRPILNSLSATNRENKIDIHVVSSGEEENGKSTNPNIITTLLNSFDHYYVSLEKSISVVDKGIHQNTYFKEWGVALISLVPSLLLGIDKPKAITYYNSMYITGDYGVAQIPPGIIGSAVYSGGILWVMIYGVFVAILAGSVERLYIYTKKRIRFAEELYAILLILFFSFGFSGDFSSELQKNFTSLIFVLILLFLLKKEYHDEEYIFNFTD